MRENRRNMISRLIGAVLAALMAASFSSCERIYEDLEACPHGVSLRFVYDYNMEFANAFPSKVDCLTLLVYDSEGNYVTTITEKSDALADESYRMRLDLAAGTYRFVAYGGIACERSSFSMIPEPVAGSRHSDLRVVMDADCLTVQERKNLHGMYWGELTLSTADLYREGVVKMMKNTNNLRIMLQQVDGIKVDNNDYDFFIEDDNTLFGPDNDLIAAGTVIYTPWTKGQAVVGRLPDGSDVEAAYAELSVSRLMTKNSPRLIVRRHADGSEVINIPLNNYLLAFKSDLYPNMGKQEFLDRKSEWPMVFFLGHDMEWMSAYIKIEDWVVRINDISGI